MIRRSLQAALALVFVFGAVVLFAAAPAQAAPSQASSNPPGYEGVCQLTVIQGSTPETQNQLTVSGTNFPPSSNIPIILDENNPPNSPQQIGTAHVDGSGSFSEQVTLPANLAPGTHTVSVFCATGSFAATTTIQVLGEQVDSSSSSGPPLPRTGSSSTQPEVMVGIAAVAIGGGLVAAGRRRRARSTA
ncbi:MAG: hypothetical protein QOI95_326 [Acidimicrobiaceae bacterium]|jgi:titin